MYLDSAYIAKYYVNEPNADLVRNLIHRASDISSSVWAVIEVSCVFKRHVRERSLTDAQGSELLDLFRAHVDTGFWNLIPITPRLLSRTASLVRGLSPAIPLRAGDAIHLSTALHNGETEIWTNDRHLLAAAAHVGLTGRAVTRD